MLSISIICTGKLKESFWREACAEYAKRMGAYCSFKIIELPEAKLPEKPNDAQINAALQQEAQHIFASIPTGSSSFALCIEGKPFSSEELAAAIDSCALNGQSKLAFIIGSSHGLAQSVKNAADYRISMSKMTFPHQLARVLLCEQLYRACSINADGKYHK
jgi:23S rRNA (pseudouridine1915-N3)-methyltransferase